MKFLKSFISFFTVITTAILIIVAIDTALAGYESINRYIALQVLGAGAITALVTALIFCVNIKTKKQFFILTTLHYVLLCSVMITLGVWFGWIKFSVLGALMMAIYVAAVYIIVSVLMYILAKKEADELNRALNERNRNGE